MRWRVLDSVDVPVGLRDAVGGHPLLAMLLAQRGLTDPQQVRGYLDPSQYQPICPLSLPGVCQARQILTEAALSQVSIRIWGDLDVDGQTSTALLYEALTALGCRVDYRIPTRSIGHGFPPLAVRQAADDGVGMMITCDTGITDIEAVALAQELGLTVIITDHHDLGAELPDAAAIVNPKLLPDDHPAHELSGVGVAYMVARALLDAPRHAPALEAMLDLVAMGLVADVATQVSDVRYWVQRGLTVLRAARRPGLAALMRVAGVEPPNADEQSIGYQLAPRLNAAGRLGDAADAVELLLTQDAHRAAELVGAIDALNADRRARTDAAFYRVDALLQRDPEALRQPILIAAAPDLEEGVIGLVAGRLVQTYGRPAIVIAHREGRTSVGSARSIEGIDIHAAIASQRELLIREGGHPMAAGFALDPAQVDAFRSGVLRWLKEQGPIELPETELIVDALIPWHEATISLAQQLARLSPFGSGNREPVLATEGSVFLRAEDVSRWRETSHRRLFVSGPQGEPHRLTWFNAGELPAPGEMVDLAFALQVNRYNGREEAQLRLEDWRPAQPSVATPASSFVGGLEVVDWRAETEATELVENLRQEFEEDLLVYPETSYPTAPAVALALQEAPPGAAELGALLDISQPQVVYLLPPTPQAQPSPGQCLQLVAGMVKLALEEREGQLDLPRMAAAIGQRQTTVEAALAWLVAAGKAKVRGARPDLTALPVGSDDDDSTPRAYADIPADEALQRLTFLLGETAAYRRAWACMSPEALLADTGRR